MEKNLSILESVFAIDYIIFGFDEGELKTLLIERNEKPFHSYWTLPGLLVNDPNESIDEAATRILYQLTGLTNLYTEQFYTFTNTDSPSHHHHRVLTIAYYAMIRLNNTRESKLIASYSRNAAWFSTKELPELTLNHTLLLEKVLKKIRRKVLYHPLAFELLPEKFTLTQLQNLYEIILNKKLDKRNFRKKVQSYGILKDLNEKQKDVSYRAAKLFKFDEKSYSQVFESELSLSSQ